MLLLVVPSELARLLGLVPPEMVYLRLIAVLLLMLAGYYAVTATALLSAEKVALAMVRIAIAGRFSGGLLLGWYGATPGHGSLLGLGVADLCWAVLLTIGLWRAGAVPAACNRA